MWIDSHCHLNHKNIAEKGSPAALIRAAKSSGVSGILTICCRMAEEVEELLGICSSHENVWCSIGTHPHDTGKDSEKAFGVIEIMGLCARSDKIIAIGETGLDYHYNYAPKEDQQRSFRNHMRASVMSGLPLIIHTREAEEDTYAMMREEGVRSGVMHCFSSKKILAQQALKQGFYISFSGMITFPKADELRDVAKIVPPERILIETDAPFLAPMPHRGKVNEPAYVAHTGAFLAEFYGMRVEDFAQRTTQNFFELFKKAKIA